MGPGSPTQNATGAVARTVHKHHTLKMNSAGVAAAKTATVIVVLGAPTTSDGKPGPDMKQRLDRCIAMLNDPRHDRSLVVVTGGNPRTYGSPGVVREGVCMRDYLVEEGGIPIGRILVEENAVHTFHNALYVKTLLKSCGLLAGDSPVELTVLTTDWHMERSMICFKLAYIDAPNVELLSEAVPSDPTDPFVISRTEKEKRLIERWIPMCLEEERGHPDMPALGQWPEPEILVQSIQKR